MPNAQLVTSKWLHAHIHDPNIVIADCRFDLANPEAGEHQYRESHIPYALYFDLQKDLSAAVQTHGGRHPLPDPDRFCHMLGQRGIDQSKHVIAYDNQGGAMAARLWWLLTYLGHANVSLLDGGYRGWLNHGYPVTPKLPKLKKTTFAPNVQTDMLATMADVRQMTADSPPLIDSRAPERYRGEHETIDRKAGHIPGARNVFWQANLHDNEYWKSPTAIEENFSFVPEGEQPFVYCGSGVTACANIFALARIGRSAKLYAGSWSDWISYDENPVETDVQ